MDTNSPNTTDACSCGAPPSEWEMFEDTVKKGSSWLNVVMWCAAGAGGALVLGFLLMLH